MSAGRRARDRRTAGRTGQPRRRCRPAGVGRGCRRGSLRGVPVRGPRCVMPTRLRPRCRPVGADGGCRRGPLRGVPVRGPRSVTPTRLRRRCRPVGMGRGCRRGSRPGALVTGLRRVMPTRGLRPSRRPGGVAPGSRRELRRGVSAQGSRPVRRCVTPTRLRPRCRPVGVGRGCRTGSRRRVPVAGPRWGVPARGLRPTRCPGGAARGSRCVMPTRLRPSLRPVGVGPVFPVGSRPRESVTGARRGRFPVGRGGLLPEA